MEKQIRTVTDLKTKLRAELKMRQNADFTVMTEAAAEYTSGYNTALESVLEQIDEVMAA